MAIFTIDKFDTIGTDRLVDATSWEAASDPEESAIVRMAALRNQRRCCVIQRSMSAPSERCDSSPGCVRIRHVVVQ